jgi:hypothetical protein
MKNKTDKILKSRELNRSQEKMLKLFNIAAAVVIKEDKLLLKELAKY